MERIGLGYGFIWAQTLAIAMQTFIAILEEIAKIEDIVNRNEDLGSIVAVLQEATGNMLGFRCES